MAVKRNEYETQAKLSLWCGMIAAVLLIVAVVLLGRNFHPEQFWIAYNPRGKWFLALGGTIALALVSGAAGLFLGFNSAGQKRNTLSALSWRGFFINAAVVALTLSAGVFFFFTKYAISK